MVCVCDDRCLCECVCNFTSTHFSAENPLDYLNATFFVLTFGPCQIESCMNVTINDDFLDETTEYFNITLEGTPTLDPRITFAETDGVVQINDNDGL